MWRLPFGPAPNFIEFISKSAGAERLRKFWRNSYHFFPQTHPKKQTILYKTYTRGAGINSVQQWKKVPKNTAQSDYISVVEVEVNSVQSQWAKQLMLYVRTLAMLFMVVNAVQAILFQGQCLSVQFHASAIAFFSLYSI